MHKVDFGGQLGGDDEGGREWRLTFNYTECMTTLTDDILAIFVPERWGCFLERRGRWGEGGGVTKTPKGWCQYLQVPLKLLLLRELGGGESSHRRPLEGWQ